MGSKSDLPIMQEAIDILKSFDIETEVDIVSAHRTPEKLFDYGKHAHTRGFAVIIAGAGGAAHLPGMIASLSPLPCSWLEQISRQRSHKLPRGNSFPLL